MTDNLYAPPRSKPETVSWFKTRPIPVFLIAGWCTFHLAAFVAVMAMNWQQIVLMMETGAQSPVSFAILCAMPLLSFSSGMMLLFMRKGAVLAFALFLAWLLWRSIFQGSATTNPLDFAASAGMTGYSLYLYRKGRLK
jgi:hypothetical protein